MEKLLHDLLRECESWSDFDRTLGLTDNVFLAESFKALADEIERYYIPRPRFEDGEPVQFGDEVQSSNGTVSKVEKLIYYDNGTVTACANMGGGGNCRIDEPFKRPTPKVYDADGVEIKVGDTVYNIHSGCSVPVIGISDNGRVQWSNEGGGSGFWEPEKCTHERPVFDADGVPIENRCTVWRNNTSGVSGEVVGFSNPFVFVQWKDEITPARELPKNILTIKPVFDAEGVRYVRSETVYGNAGTRFKVLGFTEEGFVVAEDIDVMVGHRLIRTADSFTHREPDSQKLIDADAELSGKAYCRKHNLTPHEASCGKSTKYKHLFKRQRALIERGA